MAKKERRKTTIHIFFQSRTVHNFSTSHFRCYFNAADNPFPLGHRYEKSRFTRKHLYILRIPLSRRESDICISNSNGSWNLLDDRLKYAQRYVRVVFEMARCRGIDRMEIRLLPLMHRVQLLRWFVRKCVNSPIGKIDR